MPKHDRAKPAMTSSCAVLGARLLICAKFRSQWPDGVFAGNFGWGRNPGALKQGSQIRLQRRQSVGEVGPVAGDHYQAAPDRPAGVGQIEARVDVVVEPGQVEEEALAAALWLVGELLRKLLRAPSELPKPLTDVSRSDDPSLRWVSTGRTWRVKGRIWSRIGAVVCLKKRSLALNAGTEACACGIRPKQGRARRDRELI